MPQRCAKTFQIEMVLLESFQAVRDPAFESLYIER
jgi:hypothetical protein